MPIQVEHLTHTYMTDSPFAATALEDVSLTIEDGELVGLLGHTGSGKTTLVQHLNGLLKPTSGKVVVDGLDITEKGVSLLEVRRRVGLVFQYPEYQLFEETVAKDVAFGPKNLGLSEQEVDQRVRFALREVGLAYDEIAQRSPFELSGGQMRRVAIAGVLAMRPGTLILDEPTAGLDPAGRRSILGMIRELHAAGGLTVVMVSHNMDDISSLATRLVVMSRGRMVLTGTPREVFQHRELLSSIGLGIPQAAELTQQLIAEGYPLPADLYTPEEVAEALLKLPRKEEKAC
ncbi:MAG: energy-coupling factor transporter ATPase [Candidatus Limiplasma sp.]|nr:energy-coupling factor transporter ATPase [Clostridiales bacterium]MDY3243100.1 energy-coupling factor transporter ATPase [Candidatus Limiplasma sp.]